MRTAAVLLCMIVTMGCSHPSGAPPADAGTLDAGHAEVTDASAVEAAAPADAAPPRRSCGDLTPDEKRSLEDCAHSSMRGLGVHGRRTMRIEVSGTGGLRVRKGDDATDPFSTPPPGSQCARTGGLLAPLAPCAWDVTGPSPSWTIRALESE